MDYRDYHRRREADASSPGPLRDLRLQQAFVAPLVDEDVEKRRGVDPFGREPESQDVVGVRHDLDPRALQVAVGHAGSGEECLARVEMNRPQDQGCDDQRILGMVRGDPVDPARCFAQFRVGVLRGAPGGVNGSGGHAGAREAAERFEQRPVGGHSLRLEALNVRFEFLHTERCE